MTQAEQMALAILQNSPDFRVLHRMAPGSLGRADVSADIPRERVVLLDTETTGKDSRTDKIIELGMVKFDVNPVTHEFLGVVDQFNGLEDPGFPIPAEASKVNGILDEDVRGHRLDDQAVGAFLQDSTWAVAHNAEFDRKLCERRFPAVFPAMRWGCSQHQVDWAAQGIESAKLAFIAYRLSFFYDAHRAVNDCLATLYALTRVRADGTTGLQELLGRAPLENRRIWALNAPYEAKDLLKKRGYRWSDGSDLTSPKAWHVEIPASQEHAEIAWLAESVYGRPASALALKITAIDAYSRFSGRA